MDSRGPRLPLSGYLEADRSNRGLKKPSSGNQAEDVLVGEDASRKRLRHRDSPALLRGVSPELLEDCQPHVAAGRPAALARCTLDQPLGVGGKADGEGLAARHRLTPRTA